MEFQQGTSDNFKVTLLITGTMTVDFEFSSSTLVWKVLELALENVLFCFVFNIAG